MFTDLLLNLLDLVMRHNIFEFDGELYRQLSGVAMGTRAAPSLANIFCAEIDEEIVKLAEKYNDKTDIDKNPLLLFKRFLDDMLLLWTGTNADLHKFLSEINNIHPSIKFTATHTKKSTQNDDTPDCDCEAAEGVAFLDTFLSIRAGRISSKLFRKPSDRNMLLMPTSAHAPHTAKSIPYSLHLRLVRLHTEQEELEESCEELKQLLLDRGYKRGAIKAARDKALAIPRSEALKKVVREKTTSRVVLAITHHPKLPSVPKIVNRHWRTMVATDPQLKETYPQPPLVAFRRAASLRDKLTRAKLPPRATRAPRPKRDRRGMSRCPRFCQVCDYVKVGKTVKAKATGKTVEINAEVNCMHKNIIYAVQCRKDRCRLDYVGASSRMFSTRMGEHLNAVRNNDTSYATGEHFNLPGHSAADMQMTIIELVHDKDPMVLSIREQHYIRLFNAHHRGMNRNNG